jgi:hypothetical protein
MKYKCDGHHGKRGTIWRQWGGNDLGLNALNYGSNLSAAGNALGAKSARQICQWVAGFVPAG